jgi:DeoR/GlpR family transcriptional regulator of sugar metabolism
MGRAEANGQNKQSQARFRRYSGSISLHWSSAMSRSQALQRQEYILGLLARDGTIEAEHVAQRFGVSIWTIRRDLNALEARGALQRKHGGATAVANHKPGRRWTEDLLVRSETANPDAKRQIGHLAAQLVRGDAHIVLSAGSTTLAVARALRQLGYQGEVVTNALDIALELAEAPDIKVICTGGDVQQRYHTLAGAVTERMLRLHYFDVALIGVSGIAIKEGITVNSQVEAASLGLMVEHSGRVLVLADHSKWGRVAFASLDLHEAEVTLVTDQPPSADFEQHFEQRGIAIVTASS